MRESRTRGRAANRSTVCSMQRLAGRLEYLDGPLDDVRALRANLRDMRRANRWLGGIALSRRAIARLLEQADGERGGSSAEAGRPIRLLDVGTGSADIPAALVGWGRRRGLELDVVAVDERREIIDAAREVVGDRREIELRVADGAVLPFPDRSFDVAHASMVTHHLEPDAAQAFLGELRRVSRVGVVVNDLDRRRLGWLGATVLSRLTTRNPLTRHDAPLSIRRAYRPNELARFGARAGLRPVARFSAFARHRYAIAFVDASAGADGANHR